MVPYVVGCGHCDMCAVLFVVNILRECECDTNAGVGDGGFVFYVSISHEYVGGTRLFRHCALRRRRAGDECRAWDERNWWSV